ALYPDLWLAMIAGTVAICYTTYLLYQGIPIFMGIPEEEGFLFASSILAVGLVVLVGMMATAVIFWGLGVGPVYRRWQPVRRWVPSGARRLLRDCCRGRFPVECSVMSTPGFPAWSSLRVNQNKLQHPLRRLTAEAVTDYNMIEAGDKVMVCPFGGKD